MTKSFLFDSDSQPNPEQPDVCARVKVTLQLQCKDLDADADVYVEHMENLATGLEVKWHDLSLSEQNKLEERIRAYAHEYAADAYLEYKHGLEDWLDRHKEWEQ